MTMKFEIRSSKPEVRKKSEAEKPKEKHGTAAWLIFFLTGLKTNATLSFSGGGLTPASEFGFLSDFGIRTWRAALPNHIPHKKCRESFCSFLLVARRRSFCFGLTFGAATVKSFARFLA
jgi:hypothetical protein